MSTTVIKDYLKKNGVWIGFLLLVIVISSATGGGFLAPRNLTNLLRQTTINGILAAGMTMVILQGGIDLSIGSVVALAGVAAGIAQVNWGWNANGLLGAVETVMLAIAVGGAAGFITGGLVAVLRIAPFVITLGMMVIARGLALILSNGASISPMGDSLMPLATEYLSNALTICLCAGFLLWFIYRSRQTWRDALFPLITFLLLAYSFITYRGFPVLVLFLIAAMGFVGFLLKQTTFGRSVYAIGSNERASQWAGVPVQKVVWWVYGIMGLFSGLAGVLLTARLNGADPNAGQLFELDAIAAVVIGGTSLKGGVGNIMGSFIGALTMATLNNGMDLLSVPSFYQMVFKGLIIIAAVGLDKGQRQN